MNMLKDELIPDGVAIIGMAGRFPGANTIEEFWHNLCNGVESISRLSPTEDRAIQRDPSLRDNHRYVSAGAFLDALDLFDAPFFGYNAREAQIMDPQQRLFLECAWEALEHAGYDAYQYTGRIGVYAGTGMNAYLLEHIMAQRSQLKTVGDFELMLSSEKDFLATRVAYKLGLTGQAITVQTACSTSLVAVALACQSLRAYQCDMMLAGGVSLQSLEKAGYLYEQGGIASPDGHCRAFDAQANGTVGGSGLGVVVLKRLEDALADGDQIYAVIKGSALNNDGDHKMGYTTPSIDGQADVIAEALALAEVSAESIRYVEAHGTGTAIGDPIEIAALTKAFRASASSDQTGYCAIGSVKTNIGHLDAAAGISGLIKTSLALHHKKLPPSLHFHTPNPHIDFANSPFYVNTHLSAWPVGENPRRAGVSAFGIGGTNVHMVLEEAPTTLKTAATHLPQLLVLSAKTASALETQTDNLATYMQTQPDGSLADIASTLQLGRRAMPYRRMLVCSRYEDATAHLRSRDPRHVSSAVQETGDRSLVFLFPGQGAQYVTMGLQLHESEKVYRECIDYCAEHLHPYLQLDLRDLLFPAEDQKESSTLILNQTDIAQSALFVTEYALVRLLEKYNIRPQAMIGHSLGEYVAACVSGVISLDDVLYLVSERGRLMQSMEKGAMLSVSAPEEIMRDLLNAELAVSVVFGPSLCVVGGSLAAIETLAQRLREMQIEHSRLHTSHAFHSPMMDSMLEPFRQVFQKITLHPPRLPYVSCTTGTWITPEEACNPDYWIKHLRYAVRLGESIQTILATPGRVLVEVGPSQTLKVLIRQLSPASASTLLTMTTMRHPLDQQADYSVLLHTLGKLWLAGVSVNFSALHTEQPRRRVALPTYPFERQRYWIEAGKVLPQQSMPDLLTMPAAPAEPAASAISTGQFRSTLLNTYVAPRNETERRVAAIWQEFLGLDEIGIYDNFFEMGGHSLLAIGLIARVREEFQIELQDSILYAQPSIASLSEAIDKNQQTFQRILPIPRDQPLLASWHQLRRWKRFLLHPDQSANDNLSIGWIMNGQLHMELFERSVTIVTQRHEVLRTAFSQHDNQLYQIISPTLPISIPLVDLRHLPASQRMPTMLSMAAEVERTGFDMRQAPLWRMRFYRLEEERYAWIIVAHQAIWDGVSAHSIQKEIGTILQALLTDQPWQLPPLQVQFADFVHWEQHYFQGEHLQDDLTYWRNQFSGPLTPLQLPTDRPRLREYALSAVQEWHLPKELIEHLKAVGHELNATLYMLMLAAFKVLSYGYTGQEEILIESSFPNRERAELETMVAPFVNMITLRTNLAGDPDFRTVLGRVREVVVGAITHRDLPFVRVLEELQPDYYTRHDRLGRVFMAQYAADGENPPLPGLTYGERLWFRRGMPDIYISLVDYDTYVEVAWEYSTQLFDKATIQRMFDDYHTLLEQIIADPGQKLSELLRVIHPIRNVSQS